MTTIIISVGSMSLAQADKQQEAIRKIMVERKLDYGPAINVYIDEQQTQKVREDARARVRKAGVFHLLVSGNDGGDD